MSLKKTVDFLGVSSKCGRDKCMVCSTLKGEGLLPRSSGIVAHEKHIYGYCLLGDVSRRLDGGIVHVAGLKSEM